MKCEMNAYHPTLWRTCRTLAHVKRLACLKAVIEHPSSSVSEIAERLRVPVNQASLFLRALQARGLICAQRQSRWVRYAPSPDPLVAGSSSMLKALRRALVDEKRPESDVRHTLTGFTHPRRLVILCHLQMDRPVTVEALAAGTRISLAALLRHLKKLAARNLARCNADQEWLLTAPPNDLAQTLLNLVLSDKA